MNSTLEIIAFNTVSEEYSWDNGLPLQNNLEPLSSHFNDDIRQFSGNAPFVSVLLSSTNTYRTSSVGVRRTIDFGDRYNTNTNVQFSTLTGRVHFSHAYIMPGTYTITFKEEEYVIAKNPAKFPPASYFHSSNTDAEKNTILVPAYWHWENYKAELGSDSNKIKRGQPTTWKQLSFQEPLNFEYPQQLRWSEAAFCINTPPD